MSHITHGAASRPPVEAPVATRRISAEHLALAGMAVMAVLLVAGAVVLWARNGAAVFFDTVSAGIASCL